MIKKYLLIGGLLFSGVLSFAQNLSVIATDGIETCSVGAPVNLSAAFTNAYQTTSYTVSSIPPTSPFQTLPPTATNLVSDDNWSQIFDLKRSTQSEPFNFSFYGNTYNKCLINTNGVISFSIAGQVLGGVYNPLGGAGWVIEGAIPYNPGTTNGPYLNAIHGVFQDTNPSIGNPNINFDVVGTYPNRAFVFNMNNVSNYNCASVVHSSQIVLYEGSNIIDVYVTKRSNACSWDGGRAILGIQNGNGTEGLCPTGRNTGAWNVPAGSPEAYRFTPNGNAVVPTFEWKDSSGTVVGTVQDITVYPTATESYTVTATYNINGIEYNITDTATVIVNTSLNQVQNGNNLTQCLSNGDAQASFDLTVNTPVILNGLDDSRYVVTYYSSMSDANAGINPILPTNAVNYSVNVNEQATIYVRVEDFFSSFSCFTVKQFNVTAASVPSAPTGSANQTFVGGETLADLEVTGQNIQWYGSATGNDLLPDSTPLVDGTIYFASQTNSAGCQSRMAVPSRLAVTAQLVLSNEDWTMNSLKVYPNPAQNILNITHSSVIDSVVIFNMLGQKVVTETPSTSQAQINIDNLSPGNYLVKVVTGGLIKSVKIIKQ